MPNIEKLADYLLTDDNKTVQQDTFITSAVLLIISEKNGRHGINFIRRASFFKDSFSGHVAFPGGKRKKTDRTVLDTAVRETREEVGIDILESGKILGSLDIVRPFTPSMREHVVKPYVSVLSKPVKFVKNYEVEEIFWVPIGHLADLKNRTTRVKMRDGKKTDDYVFNYDKYIIWGLTGRILNQFFEKTESIIDTIF